MSAGKPKVGDTVKVGKYTITVEHDGSHKNCVPCQVIREAEKEFCA